MTVLLAAIAAKWATGHRFSGLYLRRDRGGGPSARQPFKLVDWTNSALLRKRPSVPRKIKLGCLEAVPHDEPGTGEIGLLEPASVRNNELGSRRQASPDVSKKKLPLGFAAVVQHRECDRKIERAIEATEIEICECDDRRLLARQIVLRDQTLAGRSGFCAAWASNQRATKTSVEECRIIEKTITTAIR